MVRLENPNKNENKVKAKTFFTLGLISLTVLTLSNSATAQPKVFISQNKWHFGKVPQGSVVSHSYWIKNMGSDTLRITKVSPG